MSKPRLLIYTDSEIFGGNEKLIISFLKNNKIIENHDVFFAYRSSANFIKHLKLEMDRYSFSNHFIPVPILSNEFIYQKIINIKLPVLLRKFFFLLFYIIQISGVYLFYNIIIHLYLLKKIKPEIVHVFNGGFPGSDSCSSLVISSKILNVNKVIYQVNNLAVKSNNPFRILFDKVVNYSTHYFITASKLGADYLENNRYFPSSKIIIIPNTIISESILPDRNETLNEFDFISRPFVALSIGHLTERKGHFFLLEAISALKNYYPKVYSKLLLIVVGEGEERNNLEKYIIDNNISDTVKLVGYKSNHLNYLVCSDLFILPSISGEDMPLTILEAMDHSKIIIASKLAGINDQIENNVSGILLDIDKESFGLKLAEKISFVYNSDCTNYGRNAKIRFDTLFSNTIYANNLLDIYAKKN